MTDKIDFSRQAELELRDSKVIGKATCQAWKSLPPGMKAAFAPAMAFLGCQAEEVRGHVESMTQEADRIAASRLMLLKLGADSDDPRWSSEVLDRLLKTVMSVPCGSVADLLYALYGLLADYPTALSQSLANFIKDLVVICFTRYRQSYQAVDWRPMVERLSAGATEPQLYFALHAIPPQLISSDLAHVIAAGLESSPYREEAATALAE